jgi:hypothetical protein
MRGCDAFQNGRFEGGRFIELLPFEHAQGLAEDIAYVGITTGVDETIHKLVQCGRKGDCHGKIIARNRVMSRPGLR